MIYYSCVVPEGHEDQLCLSESPTISKSATVIKSELGAWTEIGERVSVVESSVGDYTYFAGDASVIYAQIGKFCSIASHVRINPGNHPMWRVTQHHMTYRRRQYGLGEDAKEFFEWRRSKQVVVGHDVWMGHGVIVMPGVTIGTGAVIGAGAVVTSDIPPYAIAVGVPAKVIRYRFAQETIDALLNSHWWDFDRETLVKRFSQLNDVDEFLKAVGVNAPNRLIEA